jgi:putative transposase
MDVKIQKESYSSSLGMQVVCVNWAVKYRHEIFGNAEVKMRAIRSFQDTERAYAQRIGLKIHEMGLDRDHVHLVLQWGPATSISEVMRLLKGRSAREMLRDFPELRKKKFWGGHLWSPAYHFLTTGTADVKHHLTYVQGQGKPRVPKELPGQTKLDAYAA